MDMEEVVSDADSSSFMGTSPMLDLGEPTGLPSDWAVTSDALGMYIDQPMYPAGPMDTVFDDCMAYNGFDGPDISVDPSHCPLLYPDIGSTHFEQAMEDWAALSFSNALMTTPGPANNLDGGSVSLS